MHRIRQRALSLALAGFLLAAQTGASRAAESWLNGYWEGHIADPNRDVGDSYQIRIKNTSDGTFPVEWINPNSGSIGRAKLEGQALIISFTNGNTTTLRREGDGNLVGTTMLRNGQKGNSFWFTKKSANADEAGGKGCDFTAYGSRSGGVDAARHISDGGEWQALGGGVLRCRNGAMIRLD